MGLAPLLLIAVVLLAAAPRARAADTEAGASQVLRATLDNGLKVVIVRNTLAPVVTTAVNYLVGSNEAPAGFPGMAHAQEHMMFRGGRELSAAQLSYLSAAMGGEFDASTQQTMTQYVFTVAAEDLDVALRIEAIRMRGVSDSEAAWRQERGAIEQEVAQNLSNPQYLLYAKLLAALFEGTPYAHDALGTKASFDRTTGAMLKKFADTWYAPNNAILVVVGDVQPDAALARIKTHFGRLRPKALPRRPDVVLRPVRPRTLYLPTDQPSGLAVVAFRVPGFADADYAAMRVLADVLASSRGVLQDLVADGTLLDAGFSFSPLPRAGLAFGAAAFPQDKSPSPAFGELIAVLRATADKGVDADLVEAAKLRAISRAEFQKTSIPGLASAWSEALAVEGRQSPGDEVAAIQRVTVADVNRVARRYLDLDRAITAIMTPRPSGKPVTSKAFGGKESFTLPNTKPVALPAWAESAVKRLAVPRSSVNPVVTTLPNGLRLIVQPESVSNTISVVGHVKTRPALEAPPGQEGVDEVLEGLFDFGTESLDRVAYQKALDEIGADAGAGADFAVGVLAEHFDRGVQLLADNELRPALPEAAFAIVQKQVADNVAGRVQSAEYQARKALDAALFPPGDPTLREASVKSVMALTLADVKAYYRRAFRPDLTTIVVIGKVTPETARAVIEKHFGSVDGRRPAARHRSAAGAAERPRGGQGAERPARPGQRDARGDARAEPLRPRLLRARAGQQCPRRLLLRHAPLPRSAPERRARVLRQLGGRGGQDAGPLRGGVRLRSGQRGEGARHRGAGADDDADGGRARRRAETGQGHPAAEHPAVGVEHGPDRARSHLACRRRSAARRAHARGRPIPRADSRGRPGRVREVDPATGSRPGHRGAEPALER